MSRLEDLIQTLCPDGVEYFHLGKVAEIRSGWGFPLIKQGKSEGEFPFFKVSDMNIPGNEMMMRVANNYIDISTSSILGCNPAPSGTVIFPKIGAAIGTNKKRILNKLACYDNNVVGIVPSETLLSKYFFYLIESVDLLRFADYSGAMPSIRKTTLEKFSIPLPPLPVQEEIVRILETFNDVVAELESEQAARVRQYEYYRNYLLINYSMFDNSTALFEAPEHSLDEVCLPVSNIRWNENKGKTFRYIDLTSTDRDTKSIQETVTITSENAPSRAQQIVKVNDVIFGSTRPTLKRFAIITDEFDGEICSTGFCVLRYNPEKILPKYLYFQISSTAFEDHVEKYQRGSAYPSITDKDLKSFKIPVPSLDVQEEIVSILERFDTLVNDLKSGLPAEIALRRKQYEYYRDKLLTFQPLN